MEFSCDYMLLSSSLIAGATSYWNALNLSHDECFCMVHNTFSFMYVTHPEGWLH